MNQAELYAHPGWRWCTAEGAREQVLRMGLQSSMREKLQWLEEMETLTLRMKARDNPLIPEDPPPKAPSTGDHGTG